MGQQATKVMLNQTLEYKIDTRLIDKVVHTPSNFSSEIERIIREVQNIYSSLPAHHLEEYVCSYLDQYFCRVQINQESIDKSKLITSVFQAVQIEWYELSKKDLFLKVLQKSQKHYHQQKQLYQIYQQSECNAIKSTEGSITYPSKHTYENSVSSIRKAIKVHYESQIDVVLLMRLFYNYYMKVLKRYLTAEQERVRETLTKFHLEVGSLLCPIIMSNSLSEAQVFELVYHMFYIYKHEFREAEKTVQELRSKYYRLCLQNERKMKVPNHQYEKIRKITRCYLDELYLKSIREAEDPNIKEEEPTALGALKDFPILRVKETFRKS